MAAKGRVTTYLPEEIQKALAEWAEEESRSISSLATYLLTKAVKERQVQKAKDSGSDNWVIEIKQWLQMPPRLRVTVTLTEDVYQVLSEWAEKEDRSLANLLAHLAAKAVRERIEEKKNDSRSDRA